MVTRTAVDADDDCQDDSSSRTERSRPRIDTRDLLQRRADDENPDAAKIKKNFLQMTILFAINHGCTVSCLDLANARLGSIGVRQSGILYASYTLFALCGASYVVMKYGSRNGLVLGMGMDASYVTSFFLASLIVEKGEGLMHEILSVSTAIVGGMGSSILWVSQGAYFSCASQLFASEDGGMIQDVTSRFGGNFASVLLLFEVALRMLSSFLIETVGLSWKIIFALYALLSILPACLMMGVMDLEGYQRRNIFSQADSDSVEELEGEHNPPSRKATATLDLLRKDPKAMCLAPLNILFGFSTAFCSSILNGVVIRQVLTDPNSNFLGFYTATTSMVAAGASLLFGILQSSHHRFRCGKRLVMTIGASTYLIIGIQFLVFPGGSDLNRISLALVYTLLGIGRATYEGTLRSIFADFFPDEKEGAFGNIILFSGLASTSSYVLSATGALQCEEVSKYCLEYSDGSMHDILVMVSVIVVTAIIAIPLFWTAVGMFRKEQDTQNISTL